MSETAKQLLLEGNSVSTLINQLINQLVKDGYLIARRPRRPPCRAPAVDGAAQKRLRDWQEHRADLVRHHLARLDAADRDALRTWPSPCVLGRDRLMDFGQAITMPLEQGHPPEPSGRPPAGLLLGTRPHTSRSTSRCRAWTPRWASPPPPRFSVDWAADHGRERDVRHARGRGNPARRRILPAHGLISDQKA